MALAAYTHNATPVQAIQFDGSIPVLLTIFSVRPEDHPNLQLTMQLDGDAVASQVYIGGQSASLSFGPGDWIVFPNDTAVPPFVLGDADFQRDWSTV